MSSKSVSQEERREETPKAEVQEVCSPCGIASNKQQNSPTSENEDTNMSFSSNGFASAETLERVGVELQQLNCGGVLSNAESHRDFSNHLHYLEAPPLTSLAFLTPGTIIYSSSALLRRLCELCVNAKGYSMKWNCQLKKSGRYIARCSASGCPRVSKGKGVRVKSSKKVGCLASVHTRTMDCIYDEAMCKCLIEEISEKHPLFTSSRNDRDKLETSMFCVIFKVDLSHTHHIPDAIRAGSTSIQRVSEFIANKEIMDATRAFRSACPSGRGCVMKLENYLHDRFPGYTFPGETVRNVVKELSKNEEDVEENVSFLKLAKLQQKIECLVYEVDDVVFRWLELERELEGEEAFYMCMVSKRHR